LLRAVAWVETEAGTGSPTRAMWPHKVNSQVLTGSISRKRTLEFLRAHGKLLKSSRLGF
jgi:hypothetical protein